MVWRSRLLASSPYPGFPRSITGKLAYREYLEILSFQTRPAANIRQVDDETAFHYFSTHFLYQLGGGFCRTAGRNEVIHQQDAITFLNRIYVNLDTIAAVFQLIITPKCFSRQFARFAYRHKTHTQLISNRGADDEPARFDTGNLIDL